MYTPFTSRSSRIRHCGGDRRKTSGVPAYYHTHLVKVSTDHHPRECRRQCPIEDRRRIRRPVGTQWPKQPDADALLSLLTVHRERKMAAPGASPYR